jgi:hypothetical protein
MPTTLLLSPSPQGHRQRRVSSPPQAKFGRGPPHQKILTVVLAQHHPNARTKAGRPSFGWAGRGDSRVPCRYTRKRRARPRARKVQRLRDVKPLANGAGLSRRCGDRLARLDHGGANRAGAVGHARGKANPDDQRREDERHCHHLQVGKAVGGKQRKIVHDSPKPQSLVAASRRKVHAPCAYAGDHPRATTRSGAPSPAPPRRSNRRIGALLLWREQPMCVLRACGSGKRREPLAW